MALPESLLPRQPAPPVKKDIALVSDSCTMAAGRYPKRQRTQVQYCELDPKGANLVDSDEDEDEFPIPLKRVKVSRSSKSRPKQKPFPFMNLPAEIRNKIYQECLVSDQLDDRGRPSFYFLASKKKYRHTVIRCARDEAIIAGRDDLSDDSDDPIREEIQSLNPNLLATCKAIHAEAAQLLFQQRLVFQDNMALLNFMSECTPQAAALIRDIQVLTWLQTRSRKNVGFLAASLLAAKGCVNLQSLFISGSMAYFYTHSWRGDRGKAMHDRMAIHVYKSFYPWFETVGRAKGNMYEGVRVLDVGDATWKNSIAHSELAVDGKMESLKAAYEKSLRKLIRENWP